LVESEGVVLLLLLLSPSRLAFGGGGTLGGSLTLRSSPSGSRVSFGGSPPTGGRVASGGSPPAGGTILSRSGFSCSVGVGSLLLLELSGTFIASPTLVDLLLGVAKVMRRLDGEIDNIDGDARLASGGVPIERTASAAAGLPTTTTATTTTTTATAALALDYRKIIVNESPKGRRQMD
jgi:hypothetical protein